MTHKEEFNARVIENGFDSADKYLMSVVAGLTEAEARNALAGVLLGLVRRTDDRETRQVLAALDSFAEWELERMLRTS